ncbi:beta-1,4-galactosyltransferase 2-like [Babylonia areolata]|uniref:beta-1,4-galactosyltransferase 2-like n=1 Tax=Babylonia areolata TaxID=304850 RepID=UPI003FD5B330
MGARSWRAEECGCQFYEAASLSASVTAMPGFKLKKDVAKPMETLEQEWGGELGKGGKFTPKDCVPKDQTAIIIPCRNRWTHLRILLNHLIPFLIRQQVSFTIFVVESDQVSHFNKGVLFNMGIREALLSDNFTCFIFHDADMVPLNDHTLYRCGPQPMQLCSGIDKYKNRLRSQRTVGGVAALTRAQVEAVNGYSNSYFGWGFEDDDLYWRLTKIGYSVSRPPVKIALYHMILHPQDKGNEVTKQTQLLRKRKGTTSWMSSDGYRQTVCQKDWVLLHPLYTWIKVTVNETQVIQNLPAALKDLYREGLKLTHRPHN